jgi:hypothetical protein
MSCISTNCVNKAIYNYKNEKGQKYCKEHKLDNMANKSKKICSNGDCIKNTCKYSKELCSDHYNKLHPPILTNNPKPKPMKTNSNPNCIIEGCKVSANYNKKGLPAEYCSKHAKEIGIGNKENELRNVRTKLCEYVFDDGLDCIKVALYGKDNKKQFCKDHNPDSKTFVKLSTDKICKFKNCNKVPNYGFENGIKEYCVEHKLDNMIQLFQKCIIENCNNRARYNNKNTKGSKYCSEHKSDEMCDNTKKICIEENCEREAHYNIKNNNNGIYCSIHKKDNMCSNKNKTCQFENCLIDAYYGTEDEPKTYCCTHKLNNMSDFRAKKCISCNLFDVRYEPYICSYCTTDKIQKTKELDVVKFLRLNNINLEYNLSVGFEYGHYRPDILINCKTHYIIVEVDEDQHKRYETKCEYIRMKNIYLSLKKPTIFIRYNPDEFYINNKKVSVNTNNRYNLLLNLINKNMSISDITFIELYYLYYDCSCLNNCNYIHQKEFKFLN